MEREKKKLYTQLNVRRYRLHWLDENFCFKKKANKSNIYHKSMMQ